MSNRPLIHGSSIMERDLLVAEEALSLLLRAIRHEEHMGDWRDAYGLAMRHVARKEGNL